MLNWCKDSSSLFLDIPKLYNLFLFSHALLGGGVDEKVSRAICLVWIATIYCHLLRFVYFHLFLTITRHFVKICQIKINIFS